MAVEDDGGGLGTSGADGVDPAVELNRGTGHEGRAARTAARPRVIRTVTVPVSVRAR